MLFSRVFAQEKSKAVPYLHLSPAFRVWIWELRQQSEKMENRLVFICAVCVRFRRFVRQVELAIIVTVTIAGFFFLSNRKKKPIRKGEKSNLEEERSHGVRVRVCAERMRITQ